MIVTPRTVDLNAAILKVINLRTRTFVHDTLEVTCGEVGHLTATHVVAEKLGQHGGDVDTHTLTTKSLACFWCDDQNVVDGIIEAIESIIIKIAIGGSHLDIQAVLARCIFVLNSNFMVVASDAVIVDADTVEVETLLSIYTVRQLRNFEQATRIAQGGVVVPHVNGITLG